MSISGFSSPCKFLLTRPSRDVTFFRSLPFSAITISTHTPLAGRDRLFVTCLSSSNIISTHTPLAGRDAGEVYRREASKISTHTPLAGRDFILIYRMQSSRISTHTPLAGRDLDWRSVQNW